MPRIVREATVTWEGSVARGAGTLTAATSSAFVGLPYSLPGRIETATEKTSPEELLAAAHGGCFTMSLAGELAGAGVTPGRLGVRCRITMDEVEGMGHQIVHSALVVSAPGVASGVLAAAIAAADAGCPLAALLRAGGAGVEITADEEGN